MCLLISASSSLHQNRNRLFIFFGFLRELKINWILKQFRHPRTIQTSPLTLKFSRIICQKSGCWRITIMLRYCLWGYSIDRCYKNMVFWNSLFYFSLDVYKAVIWSTTLIASYSTTDKFHDSLLILFYRLITINNEYFPAKIFWISLHQADL